jgi:alanine racemase
MRVFLQAVSPGTRVMAVVKADGYGHGAVAAAREAVSAGASFLGVATVEEGLELRAGGITSPVLVLGFTAGDYASLLLEHDITATVFTWAEAETFSREALRFGRKQPVHVKIDTGMSRVGLFPCETADQFIRQLADLPGLVLEGIFTHFAAADQADLSYTRWQLARFLTLCDKLASQGIRIPLRHAANSAAALRIPETHLEMVRAGIALYGLSPGGALSGKEAFLRPAMAFKSRVVFLKNVPPGTSVSYGCTYTTNEQTLLATLPVGYGDGYPRKLSNLGQVLIRGQRAPVVGRVCMDQIIVRVDHIKGVAAGDEVVLFGNQEGATLSADEVAAWLETINYEVVTAVSRRVPRVYLRQGNQEFVRDYFAGAGEYFLGGACVGGNKENYD